MTSDKAHTGTRPVSREEAILPGRVRRQLVEALEGCAHRRWKHRYSVSLLLTLIALAPLAAASPPDPLWIAGIYDAADSDDVVQLLTALDGAVDGRSVIAGPVSIISGIPLTALLAIRDSTPRHIRARAPPKS